MVNDLGSSRSLIFAPSSDARMVFPPIAAFRALAYIRCMMLNLVLPPCVRREGVTEAAGKLQAEGLLHYSRCKITVLGRTGLEAAARHLYPAEKEQDQNHQQHHPDNAAGRIAPLPAVRPGGNHTKKRQHQDNQKYRSQCHVASPR